MSISRVLYVVAAIVFALWFFGVAPVNMLALGLFLIALGLAA